MAQILKIQTFNDSRGSLTVLDSIIPFAIKRLFYIYSIDVKEKGGHRHHQTHQAVICLAGSCSVTNNDKQTIEIFELNSPD